MYADVREPADLCKESDVRRSGEPALSPEDRIYSGEPGLLVISAQWHHPFPFRTRKLNAAAPMIVPL
jgi:hypothetical protein